MKKLLLTLFIITIFASGFVTTSLYDPTALHQDGGDDLTGNWVISANDVNLEAGTLFAAQVTGTKLTLDIGSEIEDDAGEWTCFCGDGVLWGGLSIDIPQAAGNDFYYGYNGTESHRFGQRGTELVITSTGALNAASQIVCNSLVIDSLTLDEATIASSGPLTFTTTDSTTQITSDNITLSTDGDLEVIGTNPSVVVTGSNTGFVKATDGTCDTRILSAAAGAIMGSFSDHDLILYANSAERARCTTGGDFLITGNNIGKVTTDEDLIAMAANLLTVNGAVNIASGQAYDINSVNALNLNGTDCVAIGAAALDSLTTGSENFALGTNALTSITDGIQNIGIGVNALQLGNPSYCTAIGRQALYRITGNYNLGIGYKALGNTAAGTYTGIGNNGIAPYALYKVTTGSNNNAFGYSAGYFLTTAARCIFIGDNAGYRQSTTSDLLIIDNRRRADAATEASNAILYGVMAALPADQTLKVNAALNCTEDVDISAVLDVNDVTVNGVPGLTGTYAFGGGESDDIATMTFSDGILTGVTTVP